MSQPQPRLTPTIRFIEFMGLPGSGKSTIASHLEADLKKFGVKTITRSVELADYSPFPQRHLRRFVHVLRNAVKCRQLYIQAWKVIRSSRQRSHWDLAKVTWNFWSVAALMADWRTGEDRIIILDQGLFQAIWSIQLSSSRTLPAGVWKELLHAAGISDLLVVSVQSEIPIASYRLVARTTNRTRLVSHARKYQAFSWETAADNMAALISLAYATLPRDQGGDRVITIENDVSCPQEAASALASAFLARARPVPSRGFSDARLNI